MYMNVYERTCATTKQAPSAMSFCDTLNFCMRL